MTSIATALTALQSAAVSILTADPFYNGAASPNGKSVPIVTETRGSIPEQIQLCLAQVGIAALVMTPSFTFHAPMTQDLSGFAALTIGIYEDAPINQSPQGVAITAIELVERTMCILQWAQHGVPDAATAREPTAATRFLGTTTPLAFVGLGPPLQYNVNFQAHVTLNATYQ
jgi:hypothetical protein